MIPRKIRNRLVTAAIAAVIALATLWTQREADCTLQYADRIQPVVTSPALAQKTKLLCYDGYALMHSGVSRTPVWAAEHLTAERVNVARQLRREDKFHPDERLSRADRAELEDYARSGFDRGHVAPSGDMPTEQAQYESFSLANMIPQNPENNQNLWAGIEEATRRFARRNGEVYVVTGPIFEGSSLQRLNGRVLVPTAVFKAIYDPVRKQGGAYVARNEEGMEYETLSLAELAQRTNVDPFPHLPQEIKTTKMKLPAPQSHRSRKSKKASAEAAAVETEAR